MSADFVDLNPDVVTTAGHSTAGTAGTWHGWAGRAEGLLRDTAGSAKDATVSAAFESYLSTWNPPMQAIGHLAHALGANVAAGSGVMVGADTDSAGLLNTQIAAAQATGSHLSRPITG